MALDPRDSIAIAGVGVAFLAVCCGDKIKDWRDKIIKKCCCRKGSRAQQALKPKDLLADLKHLQDRVFLAYALRELKCFNKRKAVVTEHDKSAYHLGFSYKDVSSTYKVMVRKYFESTKVDDISWKDLHVRKQTEATEGIEKIQLEYEKNLVKKRQVQGSMDPDLQRSCTEMLEQCFPFAHTNERFRSRFNVNAMIAEDASSILLKFEQEYPSRPLTQGLPTHIVLLITRNQAVAAAP